MKKSGFTLVELIAVIVILAMLITLAVTVSLSWIDKSKEKSKETLIQSIELAAKQYVMDYKSELTTLKTNDYIYITLQELTEKEYFTNSLVDPITEKSLPLTDTVYVTIEANGTITSTYDIDQKTKAKLTLIGSYNEYIKKGSTYTELGVTAIDKNGNNVSNSVTITGTIDTSIEGTYKITYEYENVSIIRNVIVYSGNMPSSEDISKLTTHIRNLYAKNDPTNGLEKDDTKDENIRYVGSNPNNYVEFGNIGELWRIIGVFEVETASGAKEKLVKIVRNESLLNASWDSSASTVNNGFGVNEWSEADLKVMLNDYYYGTSSTCTYCNGSREETCTNDCSSTITKIGSTYKEMIEEVVWNTGAITWEYGRVTPALTAYNEERGTTTGKICASGSYCNDTVTRTTEWTGRVGLIYPSDYGYASTDTSCRANIYDYTNYSCKNNNWLHNDTNYWLLSPIAPPEYAYYAWVVNSFGYAGYRDAHFDRAVRPSIYLKSEVLIESGLGTSSDPYKLSI